MCPRMPILVAACLSALLPAFTAPAAEDRPNLVLNGDFSKIEKDAPAHWSTAGDGRVVQQALTVNRDDQGRSFARLACTRFEFRGGGASHAMLAQVGGVRLTRGKLYEFSCRMRCEGIRGRSVHVAISDTKTWANCGLYEELSVGAAWRTYRRVFHATADVAASSRFQIWYLETGVLEVADVRIVEFDARNVKFTKAIPDPPGRRNLVPNGSFEAGPAGWSSLGTRVGWCELAGLYGRIVEGDAAHGRAFLRIPLGGVDTPVLDFDYYEPLSHRELRPMAVSLGYIPLQPGAVYTVSCRMRASADDVPAVLGVRTEQPEGGRTDHLQTVRLTSQWKAYSLSFRPSRRYGFVCVGPKLEKEQTVHVDVDAVQLERADEPSAFQPRQDVEMGIEPSQDGGVMEVARRPALRMRVCNHGQAARKASVTFAARDIFDRDAALSPQELDLPPGRTVSRELPLPADWRGFYRVAARLTSGDIRQESSLRLALVPPPGDDSVIGVNHAFGDPRLIRTARRAGVTWYRDWSLKWQHVEPDRGHYRWDIPTRQIDRVLAERVHVLPLLPPFPSADWCSQAPASLASKDYPRNRIRQAYAPSDPALLGDFIGRAVGRFKDRVRVWEFLNEPIYTDYSLPARAQGNAPRYGVSDYVSLLATASAAMKRADPHCRVIGGIGSGPAHWTRELIEAGALKHLDILNLHTYPGSRMPEGFVPELRDLNDRMDKAGGRKPLWVTEFSYYGCDDLPREPFIPGPHSWSEQRLLQSELQCARFTVRFFLVMLAGGAQKVFIHSGASGTPHSPNLECALMVHGGAPTKVLPALATLAHLAGAKPRPVGLRELGRSGWAAAFETTDQSLLALWSQDESGPAIQLPPGLTVLDIVGRPMQNGTPVSLSPSPVYVAAPKGRGARLLEGLTEASKN